MLRKFIISLFVVLAFTTSRAARTADFTSLRTRLDSIKESYVPDSRLGLFDVSINEEQKTASVVTTSVEARDAVKALARDFEDLALDVKLYPEENEELHGKYRALVKFSAVSLHKKPDVASEWGTQALMGTPVRVLKVVDGHVLLQNVDGYLGYATVNSVSLLTREEFERWLASKRLVFTELRGLIFAEPSRESAIVSDITAGGIVVWKEQRTIGDFYRVELPDSRLGWIPKSDVMEWEKWVQSRELTADNLIACARKTLGSPYVWGGASTYGVDCSGLVSLSFRLNGYTILRDVSQIQREGIDVDLSQGWKSFQPGDLLIFGRTRANGATYWRHVGIYVGDARFIHSSTSVHESSLDPNSPDYDAYNARELIKVVRMIGAPQTQYFRPLRDENFFKF